MGGGRLSFCSLITASAFPMTLLEASYIYMLQNEACKGVGKIFMNLDLPKKTSTILNLGKLHSISICLVDQSDVYCLVNYVWFWVFFFLSFFEGIACCQLV